MIRALLGRLFGESDPRGKRGAIGSAFQLPVDWTRRTRIASDCKWPTGMRARPTGSLVRVCSCLLAVWLLAVPRAGATTYYVSAVGNDAASGTLTSPWRTLARVNGLVLHPGDAVLLRGGDTFSGTLHFDGSDAGSATLPIVITSYGMGRATIASGGAAGISVFDAAGYRVSNLRLVGNGGAESGIVFFSDLSGGIKLPYIRDRLGRSLRVWS